MVENANENQETSAKKRGRKPGSIKNKDKEKNNNKKIQPRIRTTRNSNKVLMTVLTFFMLLKFMLCSSISGVFYYCQELNHQVTLDLHLHWTLISNISACEGAIIRCFRMEDSILRLSNLDASKSKLV